MSTLDINESINQPDSNKDLNSKGDLNINDNLNPVIPTDPIEPSNPDFKEDSTVDGPVDRVDDGYPVVPGLNINLTSKPIVDFDNFEPISKPLYGDNGEEYAPIFISSGSIFAGSPVTLTCLFKKAEIIKNQKFIFHRAAIEVTCGLEGKNYETLKFYSPIYDSEKPVQLDISSAIRTALDGYAYAYNQRSLPYVNWRVKVYEEYMRSNGVIYSGAVKKPFFLPSETEYYRSIAGYISDIERIQSAPLPALQKLSTKPTSTPEIMCQGDEFAYTPDLPTPLTLLKSATLPSIQPIITAEISTGLIKIAGHPVYVLPSKEKKFRQQFRFINSRGALESINVPHTFKKDVHINVQKYNAARQETFNSFSRSVVVKQGNREEWSFTSDPLDEEWLYWYQHEFLMSEHVWMAVTPTGATTPIWVPCNIIPEESTTLIDHTKSDRYAVSFKVLPDVNGNL